MPHLNGDSTGSQLHHANVVPLDNRDVGKPKLSGEGLHVPGSVVVISLLARGIRPTGQGPHTACIDHEGGVNQEYGGHRERLCKGAFPVLVKHTQKSDLHFNTEWTRELRAAQLVR